MFQFSEYISVLCPTATCFNFLLNQNMDYSSKINAYGTHRIVIGKKETLMEKHND